MIEGVVLPPAAQSAAVLGAVLLEAAALYLGYGAVEQRLAPPVLETLRNV